MRAPEFCYINQQEKTLRRSIELLVGLSALVLPGGLLLVFVLWLVRHPQIGKRKAISPKD